jgi:two-component system NtrC family sensor kinase
MHRQLSQQQEQNASLEQKTAQLESLANLGSATAMIAHEINNLLTPLTSYAELSLQHPEDRVLAERALRKTAANCRQAAKIMESILGLASGGNAEKIETPLLGIVQSAFDCLCRDFRKDGITVEIRVSDTLQVWGAPVQLQQVMMNLILNAREAMIPRGGVLTITAAQRNSDVQIRVRDTGCGIEPAEIDKVFGSFFSTKKDTGGNGLGLALCKRVVEEHNGSITVDSQTGKGTTFTIHLPLK